MNQDLLMKSLIALLNLLVCVCISTHVAAHPGSGIVVDQFGNVYFTDTGKGVWKIDANGKLSFIEAPEFHWMAIDESGLFSHSTKSFGKWFERVTPQGSNPSIILCSEFPLMINREGVLYYANTTGNGGIIKRTHDGKESVVKGDKKFQYITGISSGPQGSIYLVESGRTTKIIKISRDETLSQIASFSCDAAQKKASTEISPSSCRGLAVDENENIYVAATGSRSIMKINSQGTITTILQADAPWRPTGVTVFKGEVYVLEWHDVEPALEEVRAAWIPRVRKIGRDGKVRTLATVSRS